MNAAAEEVVELLTNVDLREAILNALPMDPVTSAHLRSPPEGFAVKGDLLLRDGLIYVLAEEGIKLRIFEGCHDRKTAGHLGQKKTLELVGRDYFWPGIREFVKEYV
jgi:hypothetical protein